MKNQSAIDQILDFLKEVKSLQDEGKNLKFINQWSYQQRESGRDIPYLSWGTKSAVLEESYLVPSPTNKQPHYKQLFTDVIEGRKHQPKYTLYVYETGTIEFCERQVVGNELIATDIISGVIVKRITLKN
jgi:hypothetical protein